MPKCGVLFVFLMISALSGVIVAGVGQQVIVLDEDLGTKNINSSRTIITSRRIEYISNADGGLSVELEAPSTLPVLRSKQHR